MICGLGRADMVGIDAPTCSSDRIIASSYTRQSQLKPREVAEPERALDAVLARIQEWPCPKSLRLQVNVDPYDLF